MSEIGLPKCRKSLYPYGMCRIEGCPNRDDRFPLRVLVYDSIGPAELEVGVCEAHHNSIAWTNFEASVLDSSLNA